VRDRIIVTETGPEDGTHVLKQVVPDGKLYLLEAVLC
jgi:hypothetical protein